MLVVLVYLNNRVALNVLSYLPRRGTASEVGGMISASRRKKTVSERRIDMHRVT